MKIKTLRVDNIKKIKHVEIKPGENVIVIAGKNGAGKTSVLDAISWALAGGKELEKTPKPIREGEEAAQVIIELDDFKVVRKWTPNTKTGYLQVTGKDGQKYNKPQELLNSFIGKLSFDPLEFSRLKAREQRFMLVDLLGLREAIVILDEQRQKHYDERTEINREIRRMEIEFEGLPIPEKDLPKEEVNIAEMSGALERAMTHNHKIGEIENQVELDEMDELRIKQEIQELKEKLKTKQDSIKENKEWLKENKRLPVEQVKNKIDNAEDLNKQIRQAKIFFDLDKKIGELNKQAKGLNKKIVAIGKEKEKQIKETEKPIRGLEVEDEFVTYNGIPFNQLGSAEQLKVSVAMAMAMNPKLRIIRITDGSLLDEGNMELIDKIAKEKDFQIWIERVGIDEFTDFIMIDGEVENK